MSVPQVFSIIVIFLSVGSVIVIFLSVVNESKYSC